jgi:hypothetical protein
MQALEEILNTVKKKRQSQKTGFLSNQARLNFEALPIRNQVFPFTEMSRRYLRFSRLERNPVSGFIVLIRDNS